MAEVTIQLIEGLERGLVYPHLPTPVTIGREDDNSIRLNDERVSRFHAKIQEDGGCLILTDLDSTNGTRVNGHPVQMRVLQIGDQLSIGHCLLVFGSPGDIAARAAELPDNGRGRSNPSACTLTEDSEDDDFLDSDVKNAMDVSELQQPHVDEHLDELFPAGPPDPPTGLRPIQRAQISDFLAFSHGQLSSILLSAYEETEGDDDELKVMNLSWPAWQRLLRLEMDLAVYLRNIADPDE